MALPFTHSQVVWTDKAATETKALDAVEFSRCPAKVIEVITTGFSGTLDIQGRVGVEATNDNAAYILMGQDGAQAATNNQLSWTTSTGRFRYLVLEPYPYMQLVMTRSAGSVTINVFGWQGIISPTYT